MESKKIDPLLATWLGIFSKSSMLWPPILCIFSDKKIRHGSLKMLFSNYQKGIQGDLNKGMTTIFFLL